MSCCQCLKIQILDSITGMPDHFKQGGKVYLDLPENFSLELSKTIQRLSILDSIEDEAAIEFSAPYTPKNEIIGRFVRNHNIVGNQFPPLNVLVQEGSITHHSFSELVFVGSSDPGSSFSAKIQRSTGHWLRAAKEKYLNDIDLGVFEFTQANIEDNWENDFSYIDGDQGVYFPIVHYGGWISESTILVEDLRPWFHLLSVLQKGFCEIGWSFRCPVLESDTGRKLGVYILREDIGFDQTTLDNRRFLASGVPDDNGGKIIFTTEDYDYSNSYSTGTGEYTGTMEGDFIASIQIEASSDGGQTSVPAQVEIAIVKRETDGTITTIASTTRNPPTSSRTYNIELIGRTSIAYGEAVYIQVSIVGDGTYQVTGGYFTNAPIKVIPQKGDILELNTFVHPDYTLYDLLTGAAHFANAKFKTDWVNKTLWMYTPYDDEWYGDLIDGFYQNTAEDVSDLIGVNSEEITLERTGQARYVQLQFKDSGDAYIEKMELEASTPLYSREADLGTGFIEDTQNLTNPFFEPTANAIINKFPAITPELTTYNIDIPHLWDNQNGEISYKIAPRICLFFGYVYQIYDEDGSETTRKYRFENGTMEQVPYTFQSANSKYADAALDPPIEIEHDYAVYGTDDNDFYELAYKRELLTKKYANSSAFRIRVNPQRYRRTDFSGLYSAYYNGRTFYFRQREISAYKTCGADDALVVVVPEPFVGDVCADTISVDPDTCQNRPRIDVTVNVTGNYISAEADNSGIDSAINTDDWEYSTNSGASFSAYTTGDQITASEVIFRREVSFSDGCPTKIVTRTGSFETACDNNPGIDLSYDDGTNTISAAGSGSFNSSIDTDTWEVSIDGASFVSYTEGADVSGFETVTFRRTVTFTNSCDDQVVTATYTVQGGTCENDVSIVFTEVVPGSCTYSLSITGNDSGIAAVSFYVSEDGGTFFRSDPGIAVHRGSNTVVRAIVYYSDSCPTSIIEQNCP